MGSTYFCIALLALSVTLGNALQCSFITQSSVLVVNCSRSSDSSVVLSTPDPQQYRSLTYERIEADYQFNKLENISKFTFDKLRSLNLANNKIRSIEDGAFSEVSLYELDLSFNKLTLISSKELMGLTELRSLSLYGNSISKLSPDIFSSLTSLESLELGHNFLTGQLDPGLLLPLKKLTTLSLKENGLTAVDSKLFQNQKLLKSLSLAGNSLEIIDASIFDSFQILKNIDLSHNKIADLDEQVFKSLDQLDYLDLSWNSLKYFGNKLGLAASLKVIKIGHNSLEDMEITGTHMRVLKEIHMENNQLENLAFISLFDGLEIVNASSNNISTIEEKSYHYQYIQTLDLSNNSLSSIPSLITPDLLPSLSHLHLDMNPIISLSFPSSDRKFLSLKLVSLRRMPLLKEVSRDSLDSLRVSKLRQQRDAVDNADDSYKDEVEAEGNSTMTEQETSKEEKHPVETVTGIESGEENDESEEENKNNGNTTPAAGSIEEQGRTETNINTEEDRESSEESSVEQDGQETFRGTQDETTPEGENQNESVPKMRVGNLRAESSIGSGDKIINDVCEIGGITLDISHNDNLAKIEDESFVGINICKLDLSYNALTTIPENMLHWDDLPSIDLQGNPWDCSCPLQWLLNAIVPKLYPSAGKQELLYELRCASPAVLRGRRFVHFFNWTEPAFCMKHNENLRLAPSAQDETPGVTLRLGGSTGMFIGVGVAIAMVALLVGVAAWLHRSNTMKKRARNRRV